MRFLRRRPPPAPPAVQVPPAVIAPARPSPKPPLDIVPELARRRGSGWTSTLGAEPWSFGSDAVSCGHGERSAAADLDGSHSGEERLCLGCALDALRECFPGAEPLWLRDLIRTRYDMPGLHLWFALKDGRRFRCECPCGDRSWSDIDGAGIAVDRLICRACLADGHVVETQAPPLVTT